MVLYLRVVHSVDFYNLAEYSSEDEMPNRCGILHVRERLPAGESVPQVVFCGSRSELFCRIRIRMFFFIAT